MTNAKDYLKAAQQIIVALGLPRAQQNERSGLCLLALLNLSPGKSWTEGQRSAYRHYPHHRLGKGTLWQGLCTEHPRDSSQADNAPVCQCRNCAVQSR